MRIDPEISGMQIVLLGQFNPAIFTPAWFVLHGLLRKGLADSAQVQVVHRQITAFTADWLEVRVTDTQFSAETKQAPYERLCLLVTRTFSECLRHVPLTAFGINRNVHFLAPDADARHRMETALAPREPWDPLRDVLSLSSGESSAAAIRVSGRVPGDGRAGRQVNVTVEPSAVVGEGRTGVLVGVNDHFEANRPEDSVQGLMGVLDDEFGASRRRGDDIINHIMLLAERDDS